MSRSLLNAVRSRASQDEAFRQEVERAWQSGGPAAAATVARAHGFDVPTVPSGHGELSDLELEQVAGGKVFIGGYPPFMIWF